MRRLLPIAFLLLVATVARADKYVVTSAADDGSPGTFRWAITSANEHPGYDNIDFTVTTIRPSSQLPSFTDDVILNSGYGYGDRPFVEIDGSSAGDASGLVIESGRVSLIRFVVNRFARNGIEMRGNNSYISECRIGTTPDGKEAAPNGGDALLIAGGANMVLDSLFCASETGLRILGPKNSIFGNRIGLGFGNELLGNRGDGIVLEPLATENVVGRELSYCTLCGYRPSANYIGANGGNGIVVRGYQNSIVANAVGAPFNTNLRLGNRGNGMVVEGLRNTISAGEFVFNGGSGVVIARGSQTAVQNVGGSCNDGPLLDAGADGATPNDSGDFDGIPNRPQLTSAVADVAATAVEGTVDARPNTTYTLVVLGRKADCLRDIRSGDFVTTQVATDWTGRASFHIGLSSAAARVTAYVTDPAGFPSDSVDLDVIGRGSASADLAVSIALDQTTAVLGSTFNVTVTITNRGPATAGEVWPAIEFSSSKPVSIREPACYPYCALAAGDSATWTYQRRANAGPIRITARAMTIDAYSDPDPSNNEARASVEVVSGRRRGVGQ